MKAYVRLLMLPLLYLPFVLSGFIHEGGHAAVAEWLDIQVTGFSPTECLLLRCKVFLRESLEGWRGLAVLLGGGLSASLWWLSIYVVTMRWHRRGGWWVGGVTAAFLTGELTTASLEGGWNWLYSNHKLAALSIILLGMVAGFVVQVRVTAQSFGIRQIRVWLKGSRRSGP